MPTPSYTPVYGNDDHFSRNEADSTAKARVKYYEDTSTPDPKSRTKTFSFDKETFFVLLHVLSDSDLLSIFHEVAEAGNIDTIVGRAAANVGTLTLYMPASVIYAADYPLLMMLEKGGLRKWIK